MLYLYSLVQMTDSQTRRRIVRRGQFCPGSRHDPAPIPAVAPGRRSEKTKISAAALLSLEQHLFSQKTYRKDPLGN